MASIDGAVPLCDKMLLLFFLIAICDQFYLVKGFLCLTEMGTQLLLIFYPDEFLVDVFNRGFDLLVLFCHSF